MPCHTKSYMSQKPVSGSVHVYMYVHIMHIYNFMYCLYLYLYLYIGIYIIYVGINPFWRISPNLLRPATGGEGPGQGAATEGPDGGWTNSIGGNIWKTCERIGG
jgi:hypothetical protein